MHVDSLNIAHLEGLYNTVRLHDAYCIMIIIKFIMSILDDNIYIYIYIYIYI